jgi:hypothetical protein
VSYDPEWEAYKALAPFRVLAKFWMIVLIAWAAWALFNENRRETEPSPYEVSSPSER